MIFLTKNDFYIKLNPDILNNLTGGDDTILDKIENQAIAYVKDILGDKFLIDDELGKTDTQRNTSLIRWLLNLCLYYLYERTADLQIPDTIFKNYQDTINELERIVQGKLRTTLTPKILEDGNHKTFFRWGSNPKRGHDW